MIKIAGLLRKSPTKKDDMLVGKEAQREAIRAKIDQDFKSQYEKIDWYFDEAKGDVDIDQRPSLGRFFSRIDSYDYAYAFNVDRFSRGWIGQKWLHEIIFPSNCQLRFVHDIYSLYGKDGEQDPDQVFFFSLLCASSARELHWIRKRHRQALIRIKKNPKLWKEKFPGRVKR